MPTKELKDVVAFVVSLANAVGKSYEDGKFDIGDIVEFITPLRRLYVAYEGIERIDDELKSLTEAEFAELVEYVKTEFDIPQETVEKVVEYALDVAKALFPLIQAIV